MIQLSLTFTTIGVFKFMIRDPPGRVRHRRCRGAYTLAWCPTEDSRPSVIINLSFYPTVIIRTIIMRRMMIMINLTWLYGWDSSRRSEIFLLAVRKTILGQICEIIGIGSSSKLLFESEIIVTTWIIPPPYDQHHYTWRLTPYCRLTHLELGSPTPYSLTASTKTS